MRIGEVTKENYMEYLKLFGGKNSQTLDKMWGKDKDDKYNKTEDERIADMVKLGYIEEGMYIKEGDTSWRKTVSVSKEIVDKLISTTRRQFLTNGNGMGEAKDGDEIGAIMKAYRKSIPADQRLAVTWTLSQILQAENKRLIDYVKANDPNWDYGKPIDKKVLADAVSGNHVDTKV
jgi:hypothetical protein